MESHINKQARCYKLIPKMNFAIVIVVVVAVVAATHHH
jgi:hypothetical protein